jgi:hypothetical protein
MAPLERSRQMQAIIAAYVDRKLEADQPVTLIDFVSTERKTIKEFRDHNMHFQSFIRKQLVRFARARGATIAVSEPFKWSPILDGTPTTTVASQAIISPVTMPAGGKTTPATRSSAIATYMIKRNLSFFMLEGVDMQNAFYEYKKACLELLNEGKPNYTKQEVLAVNNILFLDKPINITSLLKRHFSSDVLHSARQRQHSIYKNIDVHFPFDKKIAIEDILDDFSKELDLTTARKQLNEINDDVEDEDVFRIINFVSELLYQAAPDDKGSIALEPAFVHAVMIAIFKLDIHHRPQILNQPSKNFSWEPCYMVIRPDQEESGTTSEICCYGEIGSKLRLQDDKDLVKVALFTKALVETKSFNHFISFTTHNDKIFFYLLQNLDEGLNTFTEIEQFQIPSTVSGINGVVTILNKLLRLCKLFRECKSRAIQVKVSSSMSHEMIDSLL